MKYRKRMMEYESNMVLGSSVILREGMFQFCLSGIYIFIFGGGRGGSLK